MVTHLTFALSGLLASTGLMTLATNNSVPGWLQYIQSGGVIGMFTVLFYALLTRRMVMGWTYDKMEQERDYYRNLAFKTTDLADRQVTTAEEMLRRMENISLRSDALDAREERRTRRDAAEGKKPI